jgi:hypothetical protein
MSIYDTVFLCRSVCKRNADSGGNLLANLSGVFVWHKRHRMLRWIVVNQSGNHCYDL